MEFSEDWCVTVAEAARPWNAWLLNVGTSVSPKLRVGNAGVSFPVRTLKETPQFQQHLLLLSDRMGLGSHRRSLTLFSSPCLHRCLKPGSLSSHHLYPSSLLLSPCSSSECREHIDNINACFCFPYTLWIWFFVEILLCTVRQLILLEPWELQGHTTQ